MNPLKADGFTWLRNAVADSDLHHIENELNSIRRPGERITLQGKMASYFGVDGIVGKLVVPYLPNPKAVRLLSFDKNNTMNWAIPWHQDRVIAVKDKADLGGYKNWSNKSGLWHCEPPINVLEQMLFVRLHLDETTHDNGPMEIIPLSHKHGVIPATEAESVANGSNTHVCTANRGDMLIMNMLTLHRSRPSLTNDPRRTLRIDYANFDLPSPLEWHA